MIKIEIKLIKGIKMKKTLLIVGLVLVIVGCNDSAKENTIKQSAQTIKESAKVKKDDKYHTVKYYSDNPDIAKKRIEECKNLTETSIAIEDDCRNANNGLLKHFIKTEKYQTLEYYKKHVKERNEKIKKCKSYNYQKKHPKGCDNATEAYIHTEVLNK